MTWYGRTAWSAHNLCSLDSKCHLLLQAACLYLSIDFYTIWKSDWRHGCTAQMSERKVIFSLKTGNPQSFTFPLYRMTGQTKRPLHLAILLRLMSSCSLPTCTVLSYLVGRDSGQYTEHLPTHLSAKPPQTPWAATLPISLEVSSEVSKHENTFLRIASAAVQHIWTLFWLLFFILKDQCTVCDSTIKNWQYDHHQ